MEDDTRCCNDLPAPAGDVLSGVVPDSGGRKRVALTFDDGPWVERDQTQQVLDALYRNARPGSNVYSTFFCKGRRVEGAPHLVKAEHEHGHLVANHSFAHGNYDHHDAAWMIDDLERTNGAIVAAGAPRPQYFRPPGGAGAENPTVLGVLRELKMKMAMWSYDTGDWGLPPPERIADGVEQHVAAHTDSIILMHDGGGERTNTIKALYLMLPRLHDMGCQFVTVAAILGPP